MVDHNFAWNSSRHFHTCTCVTWCVQCYIIVIYIK